MFVIQSYKVFWIKSFAFEGKTNRADFWLVVAANVIILTVFLLFGAILATLIGDSAAFAPFAPVFIYLIAALVPNISIQVRRLRDAGLNPWFLLIGFIPYVGNIILFVMYLLPSKPATHE